MYTFLPAIRRQRRPFECRKERLPGEGKGVRLPCKCSVIGVQGWQRQRCERDVCREKGKDGVRFGGVQAEKSSWSGKRRGVGGSCLKER